MCVSLSSVYCVCMYPHMLRSKGSMFASTHAHVHMNIMNMFIFYLIFPKLFINAYSLPTINQMQIEIEI